MIRGFGSRCVYAFGCCFIRNHTTFKPSVHSELILAVLSNTLSGNPTCEANRLEALKRNRKGQHSIRINDQWRVCFVWRNGDAYEVEITDYH